MVTLYEKSNGISRRDLLKRSGSVGALLVISAMRSSARGLWPSSCLSRGAT
ncbi:MAG TPA: hypothetical protein DIC56_07420 [Rhizobium sp.]|nr:hypothetical protein [Rhizobium sp.]